ncbi:conserved oligomeric Golgi complex subunit 8, putative [Phytophthora infestans T30-4]|uniref:Conserved oligomeric Golgi complex subunit 8 n=2 Tax=Phytophthora infestans TaxID=4787 RepID=D0MR15_PHYIT|nr:conserved oligomeric Golgi complex subunit 8, putative [Phytophthora infestans T30-4]EEY57934.1 conserved oligomeric Golgi complex subunit 8, putative [Phytophthora infestans T30-4]KAF4040048.1 Dor1-like family [Phytophthora infestans]KAF4133859.1 Dor1-like family [Phytophthora infestans]|eukprot:XP_002909120.1 conserved oligomeric Golgi complex subunit 8, putative [Phytophthora infestans T30-4]
MQASLKTCSLDELKKEPWRLQIQADNTAEQLRNLVLKNYHVFIQSNQCAAIVKDDLAELKEETTKVEEAIPELQLFCTEFQKEVADVVAKHGDIQFVFEHYLQLTELLEIPQLLDACIHNELFDSALDVIQFANETFQADESAETSRNVVIDCLVREVAEMTGTMREKLLQKLREDLQLALCVRIVGYLRRLDALVGVAAVGSLEYEKQLKEEFLTCRNVWLSSLSRGISSSDPYQYIIQVIDIKRTSWFDMITQYSAIFGSENVDGKVDPPLCRWATATVANFIQILMKQLPKIDDFSSIATILEQSLFFGGSLGRVGVDFRAVLVVYFEDHVLNLMTEYWRSACREFQENLKAHSSVASSFSASSKTPIVIASYRSNGSGSNFRFVSRSTANASNGEDYSPPRCLMSFPLLAEFTNALLSSLNELRLCTISSLQNRLGKKYQSAIGTMLLTIAEFIEENGLDLHALTGESNGGGTNTTSRNARAAALTDAVRAMNEVIRAELVPYLIKCFHRLFPVPSAAALSAANAVAKEIEGFDEIMREAGLLISLPSDETEATTESVDESSLAFAPEFNASEELSETATLESGVPVTDTIE